MSTIRRQLREALTIECGAEGEGSFAGEFTLAADFAGFQGHFPGGAVLPGVCMLTVALLAGGEALGRPLRMTGLKFARFFSPVAPGDCVQVQGSVAGGDPPLRLEARLCCGDRKVAQAVLFVEPSDIARGD